jgi:endonuclease/exonuclease/phosphatase (EEP) superfamily protein YafD
VAEIRRHDADVIFLKECSDAIQLEIEDAFADYPYRLIEPSRMTMGLALFSPVPITSSSVHRFETRIPVFDVTFDVGGHPWPALPQWGQLHRKQMADIARVAAEAEQPLIVAGDFSAAPWSYAVSRSADRADVQDARIGFPLEGT